MLSIDRAPGPLGTVSGALVLLAVLLVPACGSKASGQTDANANASADASDAASASAASAKNQVIDVAPPPGWVKELSPKGDTVLKKVLAPRAYVTVFQVDRKDSLTSFASAFTGALKREGNTGDFIGQLDRVGKSEAVKFSFEHGGRQTCAWIIDSGPSKAVVVECTAESGPACDLAAPVLAALPRFYE